MSDEAEPRRGLQITPSFSSPKPVLAIRFALFASLGAIALWGLFSLLDNLKEPELLRSARATVLKGCESPESPEIESKCAALRCQKALLDTKAVPLSTRFQIDHERVAGETRLVTGQGRAQDAPEALFFACTLQREANVVAKVLTREEVIELADQEGEWSLEPN